MPEFSFHFQAIAAQLTGDRCSICDDDAVHAVLLASQGEVVALDLLQVMDGEVPNAVVAADIMLRAADPTSPLTMLLAMNGITAIAME